MRKFKLKFYIHIKKYGRKNKHDIHIFIAIIHDHNYYNIFMMLLHSFLSLINYNLIFFV